MADGEIVFTNLAVVKKGEDAKVKITEIGDVKVSYGAATGAVLGGLACALFGPVAIAYGVTAGAAIGAAGASQIEGLDKHKLNQLGDVLQPGNSAVIAVFDEVLVEKALYHEFDKERDELAYHLAKDIGDTLRKDENVAYVVAVGEDGLLMTRVEKGRDAANVKGLVVTAEGVKAGRADVTHSVVAYEAVEANADWTDIAYHGGVVTKDGAAIVDAEAIAKE
jgi:uncharacterized membrane protein